MKNITARKAKKQELDWINSMYSKVNFAPSNFDQELIVIAQLNGENCGLGRLIQVDDHNLELGGMYVFDGFQRSGVGAKIIDFLLIQNTNKTAKIWCIPFAHLYFFYLKYGFRIAEKAEAIVPPEISQKYDWCLKTYEREVFLLVKE